MSGEFKIALANEQATLAFGRMIASEGCLNQGGVLYLQGQLGAGKTTFVRGILSGLGYLDAVLSPTYTLVQVYELAGRSIVHVDLYRLSHPEELEHIGVRDYFHKESICLVEWPEKGAGYLPEADVECHIQEQGQGRVLICTANTGRGNKILQAVKRICIHS